MWNLFKTIIESEIEEYVPLVKKYTKSRPNWPSKRILKLVRRKKKAWKRYRQTRVVSDWNSYCILQKQVKYDRMNDDGNKIESITDTANALNNFFCKVFTKERDNIPK